MKTNSKLFKVFYGLLFVFLVFAFVGCDSDSGSSDTESTSNQDTIKWRMQSTWPSGIEIQRQVDDFAEKVTEMSGGRLEIESLTAGAIVEPGELFDAVENGTIDAGHDIASSQIDKEPAAPFFAAVPDGLRPLEYISWLYHGPGIDLWQEMYEDYNFGYAGPLGINNTEDFAWTNDPIDDLDFFDGVKFRTVGYWGEILTDLGASVVNLPGGEVYGALDKGVIDAAEFANPEADLVSSLHEVSEYVYVPGMHQPTTIMEIMINKESWEELSPELQDIVKNAAKAATLDGLSATLTKDAEALREIEKSDVEIKELSPEIKKEIRERAANLYEELGEEDPFVKEVYESQQKVREDQDYLHDHMDTRE